VLHAAEPQACRNTIDTRLTEDVPLATTDDDQAIELAFGEGEATFGERPTATVTGGVLLRRGDKLAGADSARYDPDDRALHLDGNVRYEDPATQILSDSAEFSYESGRIEFSGAEFSLGSDNSRGEADNVLISQDGSLRLDDVSYTTCPPGSDDWELRAGDIDLDTRSGIGTARNIQLRFQGVPILYAPYLSFPIGDARKSGMLTPAIAQTVGNRSIDAAGRRLTTPGGMTPGRRAIRGTRRPPSQVLPFMPRSPPVEPPYQGPLSEVNNTSVFSSSPSRFSSCNICPTDASSSEITFA